MLVTRFNPFKEIRDLERRLYLQPENESASSQILAFAPSVNSREDTHAYHIDIDIPGVKKEDMSIDLTEGILTISGERKYKKETSHKDYYKIESNYGKFARNFSLPDDVDIDNISANINDGVLEVVLPKTLKQENKKKIEIK